MRFEEPTMEIIEVDAKDITTTDSGQYSGLDNGGLGTSDLPVKP